jgi:hypothetical protein
MMSRGYVTGEPEMTKLTLSVDEAVVKQAKKLAHQNGRSVSSMFTQYVHAMSRKRKPPAREGRLARQAAGLIQLPKGRSDRDILTDALMEKYGL